MNQPKKGGNSNDVKLRVWRMTMNWNENQVESKSQWWYKIKFRESAAAAFVQEIVLFLTCTVAEHFHDNRVEKFVLFALVAFWIKFYANLTFGFHLIWSDTDWEMRKCKKVSWQKNFFLLSMQIVLDLNIAEWNWNHILLATSNQCMPIPWMYQYNSFNCPTSNKINLRKARMSPCWIDTNVQQNTAPICI